MISQMTFRRGPGGGGRGLLETGLIFFFFSFLRVLIQGQARGIREGRRKRRMGGGEEEEEEGLLFSIMSFDAGPPASP